RRGLVATHPTTVIGRDTGVAWDGTRHHYLRDGSEAPATVHPGLWRQGQLNAIHGLFEVGDGVWQARGYDISNITFIDTADGWLIIDPLTTTPTAAACLQLANEALGERPVSAVIYTHSHVDHYGGVFGVTSREAVDAGNCRIIAPEGFLEEAVSENGTAGPIMMRRAIHQFGVLLPHGPTGKVNTGLGVDMPIGHRSLLAPTETVSETGAELEIGGVRVVFQNTPDAEAPAEMNFFFPDKRLLCMAENCSHNLHNLYPLRGAKVRDSLAWSKYLHEALVMWGDDTDTMFASHHWPRFGQGDVKDFLALQRDVYRWMHDQTLRLANQGYTPDDIAAQLEMPANYAHQSHVQGYYGTVSHNVRSVYDRYLGWYDGNPSKLNPHPPVEAGKRYVEMMGGADAVVSGAQRAFDDGDYRWVVQVLNHLVFADPKNRAARTLSADAMEQLGYQSESATWRNAYLSAAHELRHGSYYLGAVRPPGVAAAMTCMQLIDMLGVRFDPDQFRDTASIAWTITDRDETHLMGVSNKTIHQYEAPSAEQLAAADVAVEATHASIVQIGYNSPVLPDLLADGSIVVTAGDGGLFEEFVASLDVNTTATVIEP
ncbi:MAG: MBL fold metallo-hydrolase, partial [Acidimicrobiaceae bacterium]|nr:MBL fold metallo-hydrolase [Acidimicrobiaceae bacterium]